MSSFLNQLSWSFLHFVELATSSSSLAALEFFVGPEINPSFALRSPSEDPPVPLFPRVQVVPSCLTQREAFWATPEW